MNLWLHLPAATPLIPGLSLLAALLIGIRLLRGTAHGDAAEPLTARLSTLAQALSLLLLLALDVSVLLLDLHGQPSIYRDFGIWFASGAWAGRVSFLLDRLSLPFATLIALIGWLVARFSTHYMHREPGFHRYFLILSLFLAGMQMIVLGGNGLLVFVGWEMCGVASFLLIGYAWQRPVATGNALFAFVCNRAGDTGFLLALGFAGAWLGTFEWPTLLAAQNMSLVGIRLVLIGFVLAALVKSAQLPFSPWIARALEGPTPSSAIFYGSLLIHAGVYLLLRLSPLLQQVPDIQLGLVVVGLLTAIYAYLVALVQTDVKSALIFATLFQVALMVAAIGLGWTDWAFAHMVLHAAWRSWQFLLAPSWLTLSTSRPAPPPAWLARWQGLYTACLHRFWLDKLGYTLLVKPTLSFAQDARAFESRFIDRLIGEPGHGLPTPSAPPLVVGDGIAGIALAHLADRLHTLEQQLSLQGRGGLAERLLQRLGLYLRILESLLEQPRYLMMAVMATFVVIL